MVKQATGVFVFIDDDKDEHDLLKLAMSSIGLKNKVQVCMDGQEALDYLKTTTDELFLIMADINMPKMDGLQMKRMIELMPEIKSRAIPFFFHTNSSNPAEVRAAYSLGIQGYLQKGNTIKETADSLQKIVALWTTVIHPKDLK